ncbi:hypothetical protein evm_005979 [Chilo suppressalis]|nr:hypothetical protein evm_005979 [Chilo suppressalis]
MACAHTKIETVIQIKLVLLLLGISNADPQLDLPPISSTQRYNNNNGFGLLSSTQPSINSPGNQFVQNQNFGFSTVRNPSSTPGVYPVSTTPFNRISPDINNNGYPNLDYGNGRNPSSTLRPFDETNRDDRIDINNDPNFRRNDPNFVRNDPNYVGTNPYDFNRGGTSNTIDDINYRASIQQIRDFLIKADDQASKECTNNVAAQWNFETNVNDATQHAALDAQQRYTLFQRGLWEAAQQINRGLVRDEPTFRQLQLLSIIGPAALPPDQLDRYNRLINDMLAVYNTAEICAYNEPFKCGLHLQPELQFIMSHSRDWDELQHVWTEWRRNTGKRIRDLYEQLVDLTNQAARLNNFTDASAYWMFPYGTQNLRQDMEEVWEQIKPLYDLLHAYVRRRLREAYGPERISRSAPIPAHILGDMWGQSWAGIVPVTLPYPGKTLVDVTPEMVQQGFTPLTIFQLAEEFFVSMNMSAMPPDFWALSVLDQPADRHIHCQPSAWDFCNKHDYRIKMCTHVDMKDLVTAHHEMAHIEYFLAYRNQPKVFRDGANPAAPSPPQGKLKTGAPTFPKHRPADSQHATSLQAFTEEYADDPRPLTLTHSAPHKRQAQLVGGRSSWRLEDAAGDQAALPPMRLKVQWRGRVDIAVDILCMDFYGDALTTPKEYSHRFASLATRGRRVVTKCMESHLRALFRSLVRHGRRGGGAAFTLRKLVDNAASTTHWASHMGLTCEVVERGVRPQGQSRGQHAQNRLPARRSAFGDGDARDDDVAFTTGHARRGGTGRVPGGIRRGYIAAFEYNTTTRSGASGMFTEAHTDGFAAIMRKRCASLLGRVRGSPNTILRALAERWDSPMLARWIRLHAVI